MDRIKFYKFKPLNTIQDLNQIEDYLNQYVWLTKLSDFNDPFEQSFRFASDPAALMPGTFLFNHHYAYFKQNEPSLTEKDFIKRMQSDEFRKELLKQNEKLIMDYFANHGALCLTTDSSNIPMWAHYANNHQGYCLIFELDFSMIFEQTSMLRENQPQYKQNILEGKEIISFAALSDEKLNFAFLKVNYSGVFPVISIERFLELTNSYDRARYIIQNSVGTKYEQWKYEKEFRLIANLCSKAGGLMSLKRYAPFLKITGIIMGSRFN